VLPSDHRIPSLHNTYVHEAPSRGLVVTPSAYVVGMTHHIDELDFGWMLEDFVELSLDEQPHGMWQFHHKTGLPAESDRAGLASRAMAAIRDADENARQTRRGRTPRSSEDATDPKLRATTATILSMSLDDRLRQLQAESSFFSSIRPLDG
jgi:hypothetical protein